MSILIDKSTRLLVRGITGRGGLSRAEKMAGYGTNVVSGTSPDKGGTMIDDIFPVFNIIYEAARRTRASTSVIFIPACLTADAIVEVADAGIQLIIRITEGTSTLDIIKAYRFVELKGAKLIGLNCPGLISSGKSLVDILLGQVFTPGNIGVISYSGTLTYEIILYLIAKGMGQSIAIDMGGDPVVGLYLRDPLRMLQNDLQTGAIVIIGETGGNAEEAATAYIRKHVTRSVVAFITGEPAPPDKQMRHTGAIISGNSSSVAEKISALRATGIRVTGEPSKIPDLLENSF